MSDDEKIAALWKSTEPSPWWRANMMGEAVRQPITIKTMKVAASIGRDNEPLLINGLVAVEFGGFMTLADYEELRAALDGYITVIVDDKRKPVNA